MYPIIIGISSGIVTIFLIVLLQYLNKTVLYGIILSGIGFLYVGFVWTNLPALIVCSIQAFIFLLLASYGIKKSILILAIGYFLHGCWDIAYSFFDSPALIPPGYDLFCLSIDFTIGAYLLIFRKRFQPLQKENIG